MCTTMRSTPARSPARMPARARVRYPSAPPRTASTPLLSASIGIRSLSDVGTFIPIRSSFTEVSPPASRMESPFLFDLRTIGGCTLPARRTISPLPPPPASGPLVTQTLTPASRISALRASETTIKYPFLYPLAISGPQTSFPAQAESTAPWPRRRVPLREIASRFATGQRKRQGSLRGASAGEKRS